MLAVLPGRFDAALAGAAAHGGGSGFGVSWGEEAKSAVAATVGEFALIGASAVAGFGFAG